MANKKGLLELATKLTMIIDTPTNFYYNSLILALFVRQVSLDAEKYVGR